MSNEVDHKMYKKMPPADFKNQQQNEKNSVKGNERINVIGKRTRKLKKEKKKQGKERILNLISESFPVPTHLRAEKGEKK